MDGFLVAAPPAEAAELLRSEAAVAALIERARTSDTEMLRLDDAWIALRADQFKRAVTDEVMSESRQSRERCIQIADRSLAVLNGHERHGHGHRIEGSMCRRPKLRFRFLLHAVRLRVWMNDIKQRRSQRGPDLYETWAEKLCSRPRLRLIRGFPESRPRDLD